VIAAAREGDDTILQKPVVAVNFILYGKIFSDTGLDSVEINRLKGRKFQWHTGRSIKQSEGSASRSEYTIFGEVIKGLNVVDSIAAVSTSGKPYDRR